MAKLSPALNVFTRTLLTAGRYSVPYCSVMEGMRPASATSRPSTQYRRGDTTGNLEMYRARIAATATITRTPSHSVHGSARNSATRARP